jgi:hypothetical protein
MDNASRSEQAREFTQPSNGDEGVSEGAVHVGETLDPMQPAVISAEGSPSSSISTQARRVIETIEDANRGWPELGKRNPRLARRFRAGQKAVASTVRRAQTNSDLLDMRLN